MSDWKEDAINSPMAEIIRGMEEQGMDNEHIKSLQEAFGLLTTDELAALTDCRGERSLDLYAVPPDTNNPQDAIKYRRVAYWDTDGSYGEWILVDGEPSGVTFRNCAPYIGAAY